MDIANRRAEKILGKLSDLISQAEELKIDHGVSPRSDLFRGILLSEQFMY